MDKMGLDKREVSHLLRLMAALLEIKGEETFKTRSYERAAQSLEQCPYDLYEVAVQGRLQEIPGIGRNLEPKIRELVLEGKSSFLERLLEEVPKGLLELLKIPGIGPKTARLLHEHLGIGNLQDLEEAILDHRLAKVSGLGERREELIKKGLSEVRKYLGRVILGHALPYAEALLKDLRQNGVQALISGDLRRRCETVGSVDFIVEKTAAPLIKPILEQFGLKGPLEASAASVDGALGESNDSFFTWLTFKSPLDVPFRFLAIEGTLFSSHWPLALLFSTGPKEHVSWMRQRAYEAGYDLTMEGLFKNGKMESLESEEDVYRQLDLAFVPPEVRHRPQFWQMALSGQEISLVEQKDIKGDLHLHTTWSDGTKDTEDMVEKAVSLGYSYIAITDHATSIKVINGLTPEKIANQAREIDRISSKSENTKVLKGAEVDILRDGSLFLTEDILSGLDFVIASIHDDLSDTMGSLEERLISAVENDFVHMIGHPTGRLIGRRGGYQGSFDRIFSSAKRHGTVLEVNSSPQRLDLPEDLVYSALQKGVKLVVTTDAHSDLGMDDMRYGVLSCLRRAGAKAEDVLNTLPYSIFVDQLKGRR